MSGRILVSELVGAELDYWVARALGTPAEHLRIALVPRTDNLICVDTSGTIPARFDPSTNWAVGGPIIEAGNISTEYVAGLLWQGLVGGGFSWWGGPPDGAMSGKTALVAAMRAYVASAYGAIVEAAP